MCHGVAGPRRVKGARRLGLRQHDTPSGEIAHIDEMNGARGPTGSQHRAARCHPVGPIRKATTGIVWPHHQTRAHMRHAAGESGLDHCLGPRLQRAITRVALCHRGCFVIGHAGWKALVNRHGGYKNIVAGERLQCVYGQSHVLGRVGTAVNHRIKLLPLQTVQVSMAVPLHMLHGFGVRDVAATAVKNSDLVATVKRRFDCVFSDKHGAADDQEVHGFLFISTGACRVCALLLAPLTF